MSLGACAKAMRSGNAANHIPSRRRLPPSKDADTGTYWNEVRTPRLTRQVGLALAALVFVRRERLNSA